MKALIVVTPSDFRRLAPCRIMQAKYIPADEIIYIGSEEVGILLDSEKEAVLAAGETDSPLLKCSFINENEILPFDDVHSVMAECMEQILNGQPLPRGITGWYYQQFLKMEYARNTEDESYLVWDGDTVPCGPLSMYSEDTNKPYLDVKSEFHQEYFDTIKTIFPGTVKIIGPSFISEHMLIMSQIMRDLMDTVMLNNDLAGDTFWKKILHAIPADKMQNSSFSEFETYGTYVAYRHSTTYKLREWHSFRLGGEFYNPKLICDRDFEWLSKDFQAISFEKGHIVRPDHRGIFDNPRYQEKLSARQVLQIAQEEFKDGYIENWDILG